jgi:single-strand DNA-binding protein
MSSGNNVTVIGNVTRDPELRFTPSAAAVATFGLAVNRRWQNRATSEWEEAVSFFDVTCWQQLAENVAESVQKGTRLIVTGRLDQRAWETQDGDKRSKVEIVADEVGPSLRYATASVVKNEKRGGYDGDPGPTEPPSGGGRRQPVGAGAPAAGYDTDEEPF